VQRAQKIIFKVNSQTNWASYHR